MLDVLRRIIARLLNRRGTAYDSPRRRYTAAGDTIRASRPPTPMRRSVNRGDTVQEVGESAALPSLNLNRSDAWTFVRFRCGAKEDEARDPHRSATKIASTMESHCH